MSGGSIVQKPSNTLIVAKSGGDFDTVQGAIDSITDASITNGYTIFIYPGIYLENVVGKNFVNLQGQGTDLNDIIIRATSGDTYTCPTTSNTVTDLNFEMVTTTSGNSCIKSTGTVGNLALFFVESRFITSTAGVTGKVLDYEGTTFFNNAVNYVYTQTASAVGVNTHICMHFKGSTQVITVNTIPQMVLGDVDDTGILVQDDTDNFTINKDALYFLTATNASYSGDMIGISTTDAGISKTYAQGTFTFTGAGAGNAIGMKFDTSGSAGAIESSYNTFVSNGFTSSKFANVATGDTVTAGFDTLTGFDTDATSGAGMVNFLGSFADGQTKITGGSEFTIDVIDEFHAASQLATNSFSCTTLKAGATGAITALADAGGGQITATSAAHSLDDDDFITITGTSNNDGVFQVTNTTTNTFEFTDTFVATDTGTFHRGTSIEILERGRYRLSYSFSATSAGNNKVFDFAAFNNTSVIDGSLLTRKFGTGGDEGAIAGSPIGFAEKGDVLWFAFKNTTDATNITIGEGTFNVNKIS